MRMPLYIHVAARVSPRH